MKASLFPDIDKQHGVCYVLRQSKLLASFLSVAPGYSNEAVLAAFPQDSLHPNRSWRGNTTQTACFEIIVMERLNQIALAEADCSGRFCQQKTEYHVVYQGDTATYQAFSDDIDDEKLHFSPKIALSNGSDSPTQLVPCPRPLLRCVLQHERQSHESGKPDSLPFQTPEEFNHIFKVLDLPLSYLQVADGFVTSAQCHKVYDRVGIPQKLGFLVHCINKQGDCSMALSYRAASSDTSVFLSLERKIEHERVVDSLRCLSDFAEHPMLIPCIMFAELLRLGMQRRHAVKVNLQQLEVAMQGVSKRLSNPLADAPRSKDYGDDYREDIEGLFNLLHICRRKQASREGRYHFWRSYHESLEEGFEFAEDVIKTGCNPQFTKAHDELKVWTAITWKRFESLEARDKDHVDRVGIASDMLYLLIQQQDSRMQTHIARASQLDSEDMKFIALLGSVFLPANLVASILNVPDFQFVPGAKLFGFYLGVTLPLIGFVVCICVLWPRWSRWRARAQAKV